MSIREHERTLRKMIRPNAQDSLRANGILVAVDHFFSGTVPIHLQRTQCISSVGREMNMMRRVRGSYSGGATDISSSSSHCGQSGQPSAR
jgi:hypothetical protein